MTSFTGRNGVQLYVAVAVKSGLAMYAKTGLRPNSRWTPTNMMRKASEITGKKFKARDYLGAVAALQQWIDETHKQLNIA